MTVKSGSKTMQNLAEAFAGESQARNKYTYFAGVARQEGFEQIAALFEKTAGNECAHAKLWFEAMGGLGDSAANLLAAAEGEHGEWTEMYQRMAADAEAEGYADLARQFKRVAEIEKRHEGRYRTLLEKVKGGTVFSSTGKARWECRHCGFVHEGEKAPEKCPVCSHVKAFFEIEPMNY